MPPWLRGVPGGVEIRLKVVPGASRSGVVGELGDRLKVRVAAPPEGGKANTAIEELLSDLCVHPCRIVAGHGTPLKTVLVSGADAEAVVAALAP